MKVYCAYVTLNKSGWRVRFDEFECEEKNKVYKTTFRTINKDKLMVIDSLTVETIQTLTYFTYCLEEQKHEAVMKLKEHIIAKALNYKAQIDEIVKHIKE